ncbi:DoxX-like family protein [Halalkalicoccus ordinarius]|uniref:DoxX-like family protein n=1 Tax=Halalkalicoccus ordinarius TaxID=3116651 RepID=UPI00300E8902
MSRARPRRLESSLASAREVEQWFLSFVQDHSLAFLRYSMVIVFVWFGLLTAAGVSETAGLVATAFGSVPSDLFLIGLGGWEVAIGLALLWRRTVRLAVALLMIHASVMMLPLALFPHETFTHFPYAPSFEGVYIIKDWVVLGSAMVVGGRLDETTD